MKHAELIKEIKAMRADIKHGVPANFLIDVMDGLLDKCGMALTSSPEAPKEEPEVQVYTEVFGIEMSKALGEKSPCACCGQLSDVIEVVRKKGYAIVYLNCLNPKCGAYNKGLPKASIPTAQPQDDGEGA